MKNNGKNWEEKCIGEKRLYYISFSDTYMRFSALLQSLK